jgi:GNAT superfamily N-acetyltransferase
MLTRPLLKQDYDHIVQVIDRWWGGPTSALAHPIFFYELGQFARVVEDEGTLVGFLFGFVSWSGAAGARSEGDEATSGQTRGIGYIHLVGIHPDFRRRGVGKVLYHAFEEDCRTLGCVSLKAVTTPGNEASIAFHRAMGWQSEILEDYAGPGRTRIVFERSLGAR